MSDLLAAGISLAVCGVLACVTYGVAALVLRKRGIR